MRNLLLGTSFFVAIAFSAPSSADDWPRYGHDPALTGRSSLSGTLESPRVAWQHSLAGRALTLELGPRPGEHRQTLSADAAVDTGEPRLQKPGPRQLDLDGSGVSRPVSETFHERWAKILPDVPGLQRVAWNQTWTDQAVCRLQLFAYDQGFEHPRLVWQTDPPEAVIFNPLDVIFDIDGDGVQEICVAAHYRVMIFEGTTGRKETELRYHSCRPYGWFGLADVDLDGQMELVTIGDFQSHLDVLEFDPTRPEAERLSVKWRRDIETEIDNRAKWPQVGPRPVADVTGDARPEIVLNLFNDTGDQQWHTVVLDASTGTMLGDLPNRYLQGLADTDDDGKSELFLASTNGVLVVSCGHIELVGFRDEKPSVLWSHEDASWPCADLPEIGPTWATTASQGMRQVLLAGDRRPATLVSASEAGDARTVVLSAVRSDAQGQRETLWEVGGLPERTEVDWLGMSEDGTRVRALARVRLPVGATVEAIGHSVQPLIRESRPLGIEVSMPIAARLGPQENMSVIAEAPGGQIAVITPPGAGAEAPALRWQRPGRGMADGSRSLGPLAADLDGDGGCEVVVADQAKAGHAELIVYRGDGTALWRKPFEQTPGAPPVWNTGALTFWWPGRFCDPSRVDLVVDARRGLMHSDMGELVDGRSGATVWKQEKAIVPEVFRWGWGGTPLAITDMNGDGCDDVTCLYPVCFWIADGRDGKIFAAKELASRKVLPAWAAYGEPIVYDFNEDGQLEVLLDSPYILALLDKTGTPLWHGPGRVDFPTKADAANVGETTRIRHALADLDGDGHFEIASAGYGNGFRAIDPKSGQVLWSLAAPEPTGPKVTAVNIDGRAGDEILYPAGKKLVAITGDRSGGRILWTWEGPAALSMPAIADTDGDGQAEVVVQDADGTVFVLDDAR